MDELIKLVTDKVGISEAQARQAIETVMNFLKISCQSLINWTIY